MDPQSTDGMKTDFGDAEIDFQMKLMARLDEIEALKKGKISSEAEDQGTPTTATIAIQNRNEISLIIGATPTEDQSPEDVDAEIDFQLRLMQRLDEIEAKKAQIRQTTEASKEHDPEI